MPAITLGVFLILHFVFAGSIRSGAAAYKKFALLIFSISVITISRNVPGYEVDSFITRAPFEADLAMS